MDSKLHRPEPHRLQHTRRVDADTSPERAAGWLLQGDTLRLSDRYGLGLDILEQLLPLLEPPGEGAPFAQRRAFQARYRQAALRLLAPIRDHRVDLEAAPPVGFLAELYPELSHFALPVVELEDMANAWRRYRDGVHLAVLGQRVHPFYGTYAPTRTAHLELFATWLSGYAGARAVAVDVGTGCGVLALMLARAGFDRVLATDINPNAVESVRRELQRRPEPPPIEPRLRDLLGQARTQANLIAFNPPWTQGEVHSPLDAALLFEEGLFERFFDQALSHLAPGGRVVLLFSTIMQLVQPELPHPILSELERGRFVLVDKLQRRIRPKRDDRGIRRRTRERVELWELARGGAR